MDVYKAPQQLYILTREYRCNLDITDRTSYFLVIERSEKYARIVAQYHANKREELEYEDGKMIEDFWLKPEYVDCDVRDPNTRPYGLLAQVISEDGVY